MKGAVTAAAAGTGAAAVAVTLPWVDIFKGVLGAGGVPPALFLLVVGGLVAGLLFAISLLRDEQHGRDEDQKARLEERTAAAEAANAIQEKRILEMREMLSALERTAKALTTHTIALEARAVMMNDLVTGVAKLVHNQEATREHFTGVATRLEGGIAKTIEMLGALK